MYKLAQYELMIVVNYVFEIFNWVCFFGIDFFCYERVKSDQFDMVLFNLLVFLVFFYLLRDLQEIGGKKICQMGF